MGAIDPYGMTDKLDETMLQVIATRLEARRENPFFTRVMKEYLDAMHIDSAKTVLDMGCGTGVAARAIARRPGFAGKITAIDISPYLVDVGARLAEEEGIGDCVDFRAGDMQQLDILEGAFDAVILHTLVSHVTDPFSFLKEAARVVKPGGMVGIFDGDYATLTFSHHDPEQGKAFDEAIVNTLFASPRVMRQMMRLIRDAGLELVTSFPYVLAEIGKADYYLPAIESFRKLLPLAGTMAEKEAEALADTLLKDSEEGIFFGANNFYSYVAKRP
jgi:ubiquinone/menaquinone biosynthesis C-methylase UbiE